MVVNTKGQGQPLHERLREEAERLTQSGLMPGAVEAMLEAATALEEQAAARTRSSTRGRLPKGQATPSTNQGANE